MREGLPTCCGLLSASAGPFRIFVASQGRLESLPCTCNARGVLTKAKRSSLATATCIIRADIRTLKKRSPRGSIGTCREPIGAMKCWPRCLQAEQRSLLLSGLRRDTPESLHCCWKAVLHCRYFPTIL